MYKFWSPCKSQWELCNAVNVNTARYCVYLYVYVYNVTCFVRCQALEEWAFIEVKCEICHRENGTNQLCYVHGFVRICHVRNSLSLHFKGCDWLIVCTCTFIWAAAMAMPWRKEWCLIMNFVVPSMTRVTFPRGESLNMIAIFNVEQNPLGVSLWKIQSVKTKNGLRALFPKAPKQKFTCSDKVWFCWSDSR